jgi:pSer/pThr/pTyr-binding forkhead associated (FHA) protein
MPVRARLTYRDNRGEHAHDVVRDRITIGRGGQAYPVDVRVSTSEDVSREHACIRRDAQTGQFFLIDLSTLGTTLNGRHVPRKDETALPPRARIGLAETVFIDFEEIAGSKDPASFVRRSPGSSAQRSPGSSDPGSRP